MKIRDIMTVDPACCDPATNLCGATELMWNNDCGILPVVEDGKLIGIVTDRDICIALGTRNRPAADVTVNEVATTGVYTCAPDDDVYTAMAIMRRTRVHRLPVVGEGRKLEGIISLSDIVLAAERQHGAIDYEEVMNTEKAVSEHRDAKPVLPAELIFPDPAVMVT